MNLSTYQFPKSNKFTMDIPPELLIEARERKPLKGERKFQELFFNGGKVNLQDDVLGTWKEDALRYAKELMSSFEPKHEDKAIVVGMIFEEVLDFDD